MAQSGNDRTVISDAAGPREVLARFQDPLPHVATWQIVTTILPLIALLVAMYAGLAFGWWPLLALGVLAAALTVRTFIIQHDCGHGAMDPSAARAAPTTFSGGSARC
jgi:acyl-lipid omega-6 desaturase (Delta-12 desaturase)